MLAAATSTQTADRSLVLLIRLAVVSLFSHYILYCMYEHFSNTTATPLLFRFMQSPPPFQARPQSFTPSRVMDPTTMDPLEWRSRQVLVLEALSRTHDKGWVSNREVGSMPPLTSEHEIKRAPAAAVAKPAAGGGGVGAVQPLPR